MTKNSHGKRWGVAHAFDDTHTAVVIGRERLPLLTLCRQVEVLRDTPRH